MRIERVVWRISPDCERRALLRDSYERGAFLHGVECGETGISVRSEGCASDVELWIRMTSIVDRQEVMA